jgi:hypothetical protein
MISASVVSTISLTYSGSNPWTVFDAANLATGGTLQANWNDIASQLNGLYRPLLNSAVSEVNTHTSEVISYTLTTSRVLSTSTGTGVQSLPITLPIAPKTIRINCFVDTKNFGSWGVYCANSQNCIVKYGAATTTGYDGKMGITVDNKIIALSDGVTDSHYASVTTSTSSSITLAWDTTGSGINGTAYLQIIAETH